MIMSHDLQPLLLDQSAFLNVELFLSLRVNLFSFFICLLKRQSFVCVLQEFCSYDRAVLHLVEMIIIRTCSMKAIICWICFCTSLSERAIFRPFYTKLWGSHRLL